MNKHEQKLMNPKNWFEFCRKQKQIGDILLDSITTEKILSKIKETNDTDEFINIFSNVHYHWGIAIENGFKAMVIKHQPEKIKYTIQNEELIIEKIAGKSHNLMYLAEVTGVFKKEYGLYKNDWEYHALEEVLKHLTEMIKWGARYPLPMNTGVIHKFSERVPPTVVYGFHILDVMDPLFEAFHKEDTSL